VGTTKAHRDIVSAIQATEHQIATASWDRTVKVWQIAPVWRPVKFVLTVSCPAIHSAQVWELQGTKVGKCVSTLVHPGKVFCLLSAASYLVTAASDRLIRLWDAQRNECLQELQGMASLLSPL
jgi:WD40 repeat protein